MPLYNWDYFGFHPLLWCERETDLEFDRRLWDADPDLDLDARDLRDEELLLDLSGNLDSGIDSRCVEARDAV